MPKSTDPSKLDEGLERFEAVLVRPVVPGELPAWARSVSERCSQVVTALRGWIDEDHRPRYAEIRDRDDGLLRRVEHMQQEDAALLDSGARLEADLSRFAADAHRLGPREGELESDRSDLAKRGLDFVIRIRTQESALRTWYGEAFYRDRGTVD
jgi:hypothetical protein